MGLPSSAYSPTIEGAQLPKPHMHQACAGVVAARTADTNMAAHQCRLTRSDI
jgi:hypothetical protein